MQLFKLIFTGVAIGGAVTLALIAVENMSPAMKRLVMISTILSIIIALPLAWDAAENVYLRIVRLWDKMQAQAPRQQPKADPQPKKIERPPPIEWKPPEDKKKAPTVSEAPSDMPKPRDLKELEAELRSYLASTWKRVCTEVQSAAEAKARLRAHDIGFIYVYPDIIDSWSQGRRCYNLTKPMPTTLLNEKSYEAVVKHVERFGAQVCPWEVAVAARLNYLDQPAGEAFRLATEPKERPADKGGNYRTPWMGNGDTKPEYGVFSGKAFKGLFLSTAVRPLEFYGSGGYLVFCR